MQFIIVLVTSTEYTEEGNNHLVLGPMSIVCDFQLISLQLLRV